MVQQLKKQSEDMSKHWMRLGIFGTLLCAALSVSALCHEVHAAGASLRIGGNGSALGTMKLLAKAYREAHPEVTITVLQSLGSSGGIAALRKGALDLAISARALNTDEQEAGVQAVEYARTPFVFATHRGVSQTGITSDELISVYYQDAPRWPDGTRIRLILRPENDTDTLLVKQVSAALERALQRAHARPGMVVAVTDQDSMDAITRMPGSLGSAALSEILTERRAVQMLAYNGVEPTLKNLSSGSYPLVKRYYLVTAGTTSAQARQFAAFLRSARARDILYKSGNLTPFDGRER